MTSARDVAALTAMEAGKRRRWLTKPVPETPTKLSPELKLPPERLKVPVTPALKPRKKSPLLPLAVSVPPLWLSVPLAVLPT